MLKILLIIFLLLKGVLMATEEPEYRVIKQYEAFELREYKSYLVAQTKVTGTFDEMGGKAFRILVKYISGDNKQTRNIEMTAPVIQEDVEQKGQKIPMTAPVIQESDNENFKSAVFSFVMPQTFTLKTLPLPLDKRITIKEIPARVVAVREYSGSWGEEKYKKNEATLLKALRDAGIKTKGSPNFARYNSPFSLWFMRRNEIIIEVER